MNELDDRIRNFIELNSAPVSAEEVLARASFERQSFRRRQSHNVRRTLPLLCGVATVVIAIIVSAILVSASRPGNPNPPRAKSPDIPKVSAATLLDSIAVRAASEKALEPGPGQDLYVATIESMTDGQSLPAVRGKIFWYDSEELIQTWTSPISQSHQTYTIVGRPIFISASDRETWVRDGSKPLGSGNSSGPPPPYYNVASLPTRPTAMVTFFDSQSELPSRSTYPNVSAWEFSVALNYLQSGASSAQRAALLRFIGSIHGVRLMGHARSVATNETGSVVGLPVSGGGLTEEALFDPSTSSLIETRFVFTTLPTEGPRMPEPTPAVGEIESYTDFVFAGLTRTNSGYSRPPGTPTFPPAWPFTEKREPLPGFLESGAS